MRANTNSVKSRLTVVNVVILLTSLIGIFTILEVGLGVRLHESNIRHLGLSSKFNDHLRTVDFEEKSGLEETRDLLIKIRQEPIGCLESLDTLASAGLKILGTYGIVEICEADIVIADRALELVDMMERQEIDVKIAREEMHEIAEQFHMNSFNFRPLVGKTVDTLLAIAAIMMIAKGLSVIVITLSASRSILEQFDHSRNMENTLSEKNSALNASIEELESQKKELAEAHQLAEKNALHDPLTDLPNRRFLDQKLSEYLEKQARIAVFHVDIDRFKQINDTKGHDAGDHILVHVASKLRCLAKKEDFVARIGGDEFIVVASLNEKTDRLERINSLASEIVETLNKPVNYNGFDCRLSVSVGVAIQETPLTQQTECSDLLINADVALYRSKLNGRNRFDFFDAELQSQIRHKKSLADEILEGLEKREFIPFYQPQFDADNMDMQGVEALARWNHPSRGLLAPNEFLPVAEELGVIADIDRHILEMAWRDYSDWKKQGLMIPRFSVNVSLKRLSDPSLIDSIRELDIPSEVISFELLESIFLDDTDVQVKWAIDALQEMGIDLEIDDFGSGHASILGLLELQPNRFKIDRQLVSKIHMCSRQHSLVRSIVEIGKSLNLEVTAEGVELPEHVKILRDFGCNTLQGYLLAKPMSNEQLQNFYAEQNWRQAV